MVTRVGATGFAPSVQIKPYNPEQAKYQKLWDRPEYRHTSPGESWAMSFLAQAKPKRDAEVIDFGCGTGRGGLMLAILGGMKVTFTDFAENCLDEEVAGALKTQKRLRFVQGDLTDPCPVNAQYGYCCDVLEHIPTEDVPTVLRNILGSAKHCFFAISTVPDVMGGLIGEQLHLTVKPASWWAEQLTSLGAVIHWKEEREGCCAFYCTAWKDPKDLIAGTLNVDLAVIDEQVRQNILAGWTQATPHERQDREVVVLCGGPSMNDFVEEITKLRESGAALVTVNGAYHWALNHGLTPSAQIVLDAREFNHRFTEPVLEQTKYLIASQVHPSTLDGLPKDRTYLWHSGISPENEKLVRDRNGGHFFPIPGGCTVVLRAIPLLRMLGFYRLHMFGFDSCIRGEEHHAYAQAENDGEQLIPVSVGGKTFQCAPWMVAQASEFRDVVGLMGDEVELAVYGDGLIAAIISAGAELSEE